MFASEWTLFTGRPGSFSIFVALADRLSPPPPPSPSLSQHDISLRSPTTQEAHRARLSWFIGVFCLLFASPKNTGPDFPTFFCSHPAWKATAERVSPQSPCYTIFSPTPQLAFAGVTVLQPTEGTGGRRKTASTLGDEPREAPVAAAAQDPGGGVHAFVGLASRG